MRDKGPTLMATGLVRTLAIAIGASELPLCRAGNMGHRPGGLCHELTRRGQAERRLWDEWQKGGGSVIPA